MKCENCEIEHLGEYGSGRFCSNKCARGFSTKNKRKEINNKVSIKLTKSFNQKLKSCTCIICHKEFFKIRKAKTCSITCLNVVKKLNSRAGAKTKTKNKTHSGWHNRRGEQSYPEKYFTDLFNKENISGYIPERKVGKWFIDFAFEDKKIAVEIDGRQHKDEDRKKSDNEKDEFLRNLGWSVIRIDWFNPVNEKNRLLLYPQIKRLKEILSVA